MSITAGVKPIKDLLKVTFGTRLTLLVAPICEIYGVEAIRGGTVQHLRIQLPDSFALDVNLYDQGSRVPMSLMGGFLKITADPSSKRALTWDRNLSEKPSVRLGIVSVRPPARVEYFTADEAARCGLMPTFDFSEMKLAVAEPPARLSQPEPVATSPTPPVAPFSYRVTPALPSPSFMQAMASQFAQCLAIAKQSLGPGADPEDVRATARVIFDEIKGSQKAAV